MNTNNLLSECLSILHSIKDNKKSLEKLLEFMEEEFVPKTPVVAFLPDCKLQIDEKYRPIVKEIAEYLEMGHIVFVNPETLEIDSIPKNYDPMMTGVEFDYDKVENWIEIEPLESHESFEVMESFVESLPDGKEKNKLADAICGYKPFANFNRLIHNSEERENWFKHRTHWFEKYVIAKIENQAAVLEKCRNLPVKNMLKWANDVKSGDSDNLEGRAAAFYWKNLFENFTRSRDGVPPNNLLNYGYAILRAVVARALVGSGLLPTLGIHHRNKYNAYCLADDIMEPYRPFVDKLVVEIIENGELKIENEKLELNKEIKAKLLQIPVLDVVINGECSPLMLAAGQTTASLAKCYLGECRKIAYPSF